MVVREPIAPPAKRASPFVLGTAQWGMRYGIANDTGAPDCEETAEILRVAKRAGVDTLDTARGYAASEALIGHLTEGDDHWRIVTKLDPDVGAPNLGMEESLERVEQSLAVSLEALRREQLDVLLIHRAAHRTAHQGAIWQRLCEKRAAGQIGELGVSVGTPREAWALLEDPTVDVLQVASNLLDQRLRSDGFFERAVALDKKIWVRSVFLQGVAHLSADRLPPHLGGFRDVLERLGDRASKRAIRLADLFLLFARDIIGHEPVIGCESTGQLCQNLIAWRSLAIAKEDLAALAAEVAATTLAEDFDVRLLDPARWSELELPSTEDMSPEDK